MPGTINVLNRAVLLDTAPKFEAFTGVRLWYDDDQYFFAGDETGRVLEADNPWATQAMADNIVASVSGYMYQPFEAGAALLDPVAELGDGVNVGGVYGPLASITTRFDSMCSADISAPADEEIDHEYPYLSPTEREYKRNKARTYSLISKTAEEIRLEVHKLQTNTELSMEELEKSLGEDLGGLEKAFGEDLDGLSKTFTETLKQYSTITQTEEKIELAISTSNEYTNTKTGEVVASLSKYSTIEQTDSKIETAVSTSQQYTDGKITDLSAAFGANLSDLEGAFNVKLDKYSTIEQTDAKIDTAVNTSKEYTNSKTGEVIASLSKYSTIEQTDSKIETAVSTSQQYTDGKITDLSEMFGADLGDLEGAFNVELQKYSTIEQTDSKIATAVSNVETYTSEITGEIVARLKNYATLELTDSKIESAVSSSKQYTNRALRDLDDSLNSRFQNYSTITQTDDKISTAVSTSQEYTNAKTGEVIKTLENYSTIDQTSKSIELAVSGLIDEEYANSLISQSMDKIELSVSNGKSSSTITLLADGVELSSQKIKFTGDVVFASDLEDGNTIISGDCITTGAISAEFLKLGGEMYIYDSLDEDAVETGYFGYLEGKIFGSRFVGCGLISMVDTVVLASEEDDVLIAAADDIGLYAEGWVRIGSEYLIPVADAHTYCGSYSYWWYDGYFDSLHVGGAPIGSSDGRLKENVNYDLSQYLAVFDHLKPCSYKFIKGQRTHLGMIAQEVESAAVDAGIDLEHFAPVCIDTENDVYGLRYEEFVPLLIAKVQKLDAELKALKHT